MAPPSPQAPDQDSIEYTQDINKDDAQDGHVLSVKPKVDAFRLDTSNLKVKELIQLLQCLDGEKIVRIRSTHEYGPTEPKWIYTDGDQVIFDGERHI